MTTEHGTSLWNGQRTRCDHTRAWGDLQRHYESAGRSFDVRDAFATDSGRYAALSQEAPHVFADLSLAAPQISLESVLLRAPEVILTGEAAMLEDWQRWPQIPAVRMGQVWVIPDEGLQTAGRKLSAICVF